MYDSHKSLLVLIRNVHAIKEMCSFQAVPSHTRKGPYHADYKHDGY